MLLYTHHRRVGRGAAVLGLLMLAATAHAQPRHLPWSVEVMFRVGADSAGLTFASVSDAAIAPDGSILVLDQLAGEVFVLDSLGQLIGRFGRKGRGPGEFRSPSQLVVSDDIVFVLDGSQIHRLQMDGSVLRSWRLNPVLRGAATRLAATRGGIVVERVPLPSVLTPGGAQSATAPTLEYRSTNDSIIRVFAEFPGAAATVELTKRGPRLSPLFSPTLVWNTLSGGTIAAGATNEYNLAVLDSRGRVLGHLKRDVKRRRVPEWIKQTVRQGGDLPSAIGGGMPPVLFQARSANQAAIREILRQVEFHEYLPVIAGIMQGPDSTTIVIRDVGLEDEVAPDLVRPRNGDVLPILWDVFGPDGRYLGVVDAPSAFRPLAAAGGIVVGLEWHPLDVPVVRAFRLRPDAREAP